MNETLTKLLNLFIIPVLTIGLGIAIFQWGVSILFWTMGAVLTIMQFSLKLAWHIFKEIIILINVLLHTVTYKIRLMFLTKYQLDKIDQLMIRRYKENLKQPHFNLMGEKLHCAVQMTANDYTEIYRSMKFRQAMRYTYILEEPFLQRHQAINRSLSNMPRIFTTKNEDELFTYLNNKLSVLELIA